MRTIQTSSATIVVERINWRTTVVAVSTASCRRGVEFRFDRSGKRAAAWLARQDLTGKVWAGMTWEQLKSAVEGPHVASAPSDAPVPAATTEDVAQLVERLVTQRVAEVLDDHYRWVLASPERRKALAKALRDADALERAERIRAASR